MQSERIAGTIVGIVIIASIFLLPFSSAISAYGSVPDTLYNIFRFFVDNLDSVLSTPMGSLAVIAYIQLAGTLLLIAAGLVGAFSLGSGVLGIITMAVVTISGELSPSYTPFPVYYDAGFYLLWALSGAQLILAFLGRRTRHANARRKETVQTSDVSSISPAGGDPPGELDACARTPGTFWYAIGSSVGEFVDSNLQGTR